MMFLFPNEILIAGAGLNGISFAFKEATFAGIAILIILFTASIFSWSVMITKYRMIKYARRQNARFLKYFRKDRQTLRIYSDQMRFEGSPLSAIYRAGCKELCFQMLGSAEVDDTFEGRLETAPKISNSQMRSVSAAIERSIGETALKIEDQMIILATAVSGPPFLGLLGTVWGVMDTFSGIAMAGSANLAAMAPGVSAALLTTVTGLLVAIPAMFGYNFLVTSIRGIIVQMDNFGVELASELEHKYVQHNDRTSFFR